jgi:hypothetical protein
MNEELTEFSENNSQLANNRHGVDSLALMLLTSFLNEIFVYWVFHGSLSWHNWLMPHHLPTSVILWLFGANSLLVIWVAFWLFVGRIKVPIAVFFLVAFLSFVGGGAIQMHLFETKTLAIILPALTFVSHLFFAVYLTPGRKLALGVQVFLSGALGITAGIFHIYLYVSAFL